MIAPISGTHASSAPSVRAIDRVRRFNRQYTAALGLLEDGLHGSGLALAQARLLYEIASRRHCTAAALCADLRMDPGQVSRLLAALSRAGLIVRERVRDDRRAWVLSVSAEGRKVTAGLERAARRQVALLLKDIAPARQAQLLQAMDVIESLLAPNPAIEGMHTGQAITLRAHDIGDIGWIVHRQSMLYAQEYGWDITYEALIAEIAARFIERFKPGREACWVAHRGETILGSVFLVQRSRQVGQLRLLYVEPAARGQGVGERLVQTCIDQARASGYRRLMLWTNDILDAARRIYERKGFELISQERHHSFGKDLVGQNWELKL